jgi:hypothetical protein
MPGSVFPPTGEPDECEHAMKIRYVSFLIVPILLSLPCASEAQDRARLYVNAGYVTNLQKCSECEKADTGGSIRVGVFTKGRLGLYAGYVWFQEYHPAYIGYDDEGTLLMAGVDIRLVKKGSVEWYAKVGLGREEFTSTYPNRTETETSMKPDLGLLLNIRHFNTYVGWQPSDPPHINIGVGLTL